MKSLSEAAKQHNIPEDEIAERAWEMYRDRLQSTVEHEGNIGKYLTLDVVSGDYVIGKNLAAIVLSLQFRHKAPVLFVLRIGYPATFFPVERYRVMHSQIENQPLPHAEIQERFHRIIEEHLKPLIETAENKGKFLTVDVLTGDYEIGSDYVQSVLAVKARHEKTVTYSLRIGYPELFNKGYRGKYPFARNLTCPVLLYRKSLAPDNKNHDPG